MKHIYLCVLCMMSVFHESANAAATLSDFYYNILPGNAPTATSESCYEKSFKGMPYYRYRTIYMCGEHKDDWCRIAGSTTDATKEKHTTGGYFIFDGYRYTCCIPDGKKQGTYKKTSRVNKRIKKKQLTDGTCSYTETYNPCAKPGDEWSGEECNTPTTPNCTGLSFARNGACVNECDFPQAFESRASNTCVDCETTNYQGYATEAGRGTYCLKCDPATQFFDSDKGECISKSSLKTYTRADIKNCWQCKGDTAWHTCLNTGTCPDADRTQDNSNDSANAGTYDGKRIFEAPATKLQNMLQNTNPQYLMKMDDMPPQYIKAIVQ